MANKTYDMTIRTKAICPKKEEIIDMIDNNPFDEPIKLKSVIGAEKEDGAYALYMNSDTPDNLYGIIKSVDLTDEEIEHLITDGNYEIQILSRSGNVITGKLVVKKTVSSTEKGFSVSDALKNLVKEKIEAGYVTKEDAIDRIQWMKGHHVDEFLMMRVIKRFWIDYNKPPRRPTCRYVDPFLESTLKKKEETLVSEILRSAVSGNGIIFEGEKSVGKNVCATNIAWAMGVPERLFTCSRQMTPATLYGEKTTDNSALQALNSDAAYELAKKAFADRTDVDARAKYDIIKAKAASTNIIIEDSELCDWLEDGGILILNEMNLCEPNLLASFLNPILDGTGYLTIQGRGEVKINKNCVLIGTQNADYMGTEEQNEATMSRLACERFKQPESISELLMSAVQAKLKEDGFDFVTIDRKYISQADKYYNACRTAVENGLISNAVLNIRGFVRALVAVFESDGHCRLKRQIELNVINTCPLGESDSLRGTLASHITL